MRSVIVAIGLTLLAFAMMADGTWFSRHVFTFAWYLPPPPAIVPVVRTAALLSGMGFMVLAWRMRRRSISLAGGLRILVGAIAAVIAAELVLEWIAAHKSEERRQLHTRFGEPHPRYGWIFRPNTAPTVRLLGRDIPHAFDADGSRIADPSHPVDPERPSILIGGESIAMGHGLLWEETFGMLAARALDLQPVCLAVNAYGVDQAWLRLTDLAPKFRDVRAMVMVLVPMQLGRNVHDDHPQLALAEGRIVVGPLDAGFLHALRLRSILVNELPYWSDGAIEHTIALTRALFVDLDAKARAASIPLIIVLPSAGHREAWVLHALFDGTDLDVLDVDLDASEIFPNDGHPNPEGAKKIADALVTRLRLRAISGTGPDRPAVRR
jgi:hypothetical protein